MSTTASRDVSPTRNTIQMTLGDSTPAPSARVGALRQRLEKTEATLASLDDAFYTLFDAHAYDTSHGKHEEFKRIEASRDAVNKELLMLQARVLSSEATPRSTLFSPSAGGAPAAPATVQTAPASALTVRYETYPRNDTAGTRPLLSKDTKMSPADFLSIFTTWADTASPPYPPIDPKDPKRTGITLRLNAFSRAIGSPEMDKAYTTWLTANKATATWDDLVFWVEDQLPWADSRQELYSALVGLPACSDNTPSGLKAYRRAFTAAMQQAGCDTSGDLPLEVVFPDARLTVGDAKEEYNTGYLAADALLTAIYLSKFAAHVLEAYQQERKRDNRKATIAAKEAGNARPPQPRETLFRAMTTVSSLDIAKSGPWTQVAHHGGGGGGHGKDKGGDRSTSRPRQPVGKDGIQGCFHCGGANHYARDCFKLKARAPNLKPDQFDQLSKVGNARQFYKQQQANHKVAIKLHMAHIAFGGPGYEQEREVAGAYSSATDGAIARLDRDYEAMLLQMAGPART